MTGNSGWRRADSRERSGLRGERESGAAPGACGGAGAFRGGKGDPPQAAAPEAGPLGRRSGQRGIALILVLMIMSVIVALTIQLNRNQRVEVYEAANLSDGIRLRYVARSAFYAGEAILLADKNGFDSFAEDWAKTEMLALVSEGLFDNASFRLAIEDEGGKIPINRLVSGNAINAPIRDLFLRLLTGPHFRLSTKEAESLADAIKDWIDPDDEVTGAGAEGGHYAGLGRPYAAKNASLDCIEELLMVKGVSRELFHGSAERAGLVQCLTVAGGTKVNINTAPKAVLQALSAAMTEDAVDRLDLYRREPKNDLSDPAWYNRIPGMSDRNLPADLIAVKSDSFRITAVGQSGKMTERITGIVKRESGGNRTRLLSWRLD